jgi:hypothetical protein
MTMFPPIEPDYTSKFLKFKSAAFEYSERCSTYWDLVEDKPVQMGLDTSKLDRDFFDWRRIDDQYREAISSYYMKNYPSYGVNSDPDTLQNFFAGSEFSWFVGLDVTQPVKVQNIKAISLGAWPLFREALIENNPTEAAHLAAVIFAETQFDFKPVGDRSEKDPLKFLHRLQAGNAVRAHSNYSLFRIQK